MAYQIHKAGRGLSRHLKALYSSMHTLHIAAIKSLLDVGGVSSEEAECQAKKEQQPCHWDPATARDDRILLKPLIQLCYQ